MELSAAIAEAPAAAASRLSLVAFVRSAGILSVSSLSSLVRAIITAKVLAVALGPSQVGILSQLLNFSAFLFTILPLGLTTGVSKMVAESHSDRRRVAHVAGTSSLIALASGLGAAILLAPFAGRVSEVLTGSDRYGLPVLLILASFPLYNLAGVLGYVLQGFADVARLTWANVAAAILAVIVLVPAALAYGLVGAIAAVLVSSVTQAALFVIAVWLSYRQRGWSLAGIGWDREVARALIGYGTVMILAGVAMWGSLLLVRTLLVRTRGEYDNGIYQVAYGLSTQYMTVFMAWMGAYVFPRIAAERERAAIGPLLNSALRANLFLMAPALVLVVALRDPLIRLFYADSFLAAAPLVAIQALGDLAKVIGWSYGVSLFARGHTRGYLAAILAQAVAWVALALLLMPALGVRAAVVGYAISYLAWPALMYPMVRRWLAVVASREAVLLSALALASVALAAVLPPLAAVPLAAVVPGVILLQHRGVLTL
jgi:O-antigen/teichoic acid export membrane protein